MRIQPHALSFILVSYIYVNRQSVREELINFRSNEPDEAISTGGSGTGKDNLMSRNTIPIDGSYIKQILFNIKNVLLSSDDEYERIIVMKYEQELESKFGKPRCIQIQLLQNYKKKLCIWKGRKCFNRSMEV